MADLRTVNALRETVRRMEELLETEPQLVACDMHPRYNTTQFAHELGLPVVEVQHHYAHVVSCMAENDYDGKVIGVSFDGTGYGTDGTIWGGEFLLATRRDFERIGSITGFRQAGGDLSAKEGWRIAVSLLLDAYGSREKVSELAARLGLCDEKNLAAQFLMLDKNINCVKSTSMGRLFDAVSAMLGIKRRSTFEGEASMALEFAADEKR
jgi:hydrogenase maturation protein HypF